MSELPPGYIEHDNGLRRVIASRLDMATMLSLLDGPERDRPGDGSVKAPRGPLADSLSTGVHGGRGGARRIKLPGGKVVYLRHYLRGGLMRYVVRDLYLLRPPRPVHELKATEIARAAGCFVPTVHAACVEEVGPFYRGWIVTSAIEDTQPFIDRLTEEPAEGRRQLFEAAGRAVGRADAAGVYHADLTGHNVLVDRRGRVALIDFDRATLGPAGDLRAIERGTARFHRSLVKLAAAADRDLADAEFSVFRRARLEAASA